jgi:hypothetical protein
MFRQPLFLLLLALTLLGCEVVHSWLSKGVILETTGKVELQPGDAQSSVWLVAREGARLGPGSRVRTGSASFAQFGLEGGGRLVLEPESELHFLRESDSPGQGWEVRNGRAVLETPARDTSIRTPYGRIYAEAGTRLELSGHAGAAFVLVQTGRARVESRTGTVLDLASPQAVELTMSGTRVVLAPDEPPPLGSLHTFVSDLVLDAGQSLVIHDPRPPSAIRFRFGPNCKEGAIVLGGDRSSRESASEWTDQGSVVVRIEPGTLEYRLECRDDLNQPLRVQAGGALTILKDSGTEPLETRSDAATIDVTGRQYTVLFHSQLPQVTFRWPDAPKAPRYILSMSYQGRTRKVFARDPVYGFAGGELPEGTHQAQFSARGVASDRTVVAVRFDPTTRLVRMESRMAPSSDQIEVKGTVQTGWTLECQGAPVALGPEAQFSLQAPTRADGGALGLWVRHPSRPSHVYFLRQPEGRVGRPTAP